MLLREHKLDGSRAVAMFTREHGLLAAVAILHRTGMATAPDFQNAPGTLSTFVENVDEILDWVDRDTANRRFVELGGILPSKPQLKLLRFQR